MVLIKRQAIQNYFPCPDKYSHFFLVECKTFLPWIPSQDQKSVVVGTMCWWDVSNYLLLAYYFVVSVMLQGEGPLSLHHRHHISVPINTHTVLELQTKNNFSQLFFTLNMHFYHSQQNYDIVHIPFFLKKRSITDLQSHWYYTCQLFVKHFCKFPIWSMYLPIKLNTYHHLRYLYIYATSRDGSASFSRIIMVLIFVLMATAGIKTETFWMPVFGNIQFFDFVKHLIFKN